jgi:hypothetical protein
MNIECIIKCLMCYAIHQENIQFLCEECIKTRDKTRNLKLAEKRKGELSWN